MTPFYLNPPPSPFPLVELKDERNLQLFLSPQQADHSSFFSTTTSQDQRAVLTEPEESKPFDHKVYQFMTHEGSSDRHESLSSSLQAAVGIHGAANGHVLSFGRKKDGGYESASDNNGSSIKWMSSKMRLMKKMMNSNCSSGSADYHNNPVSKFQHPMHDSDETNSVSKTNNSIRVCSDCNTTTTPLWRSGPRGPKSLCNACGIRQRKARRVMEAAAVANGAAVAIDATTSVKIKVHNKEKKSRSSHVAQYRKQFKAAPDCNSPHPHHHHQSQKKLCFKEFALSLSKNSALQRVFPQDVEDAAILLMELSCGLVHS